VVERQDGGRPVFTDDSGTRARVSRRVVRALCGLVALGVVAVVLSAALHITLPGLDHPLALPGAKKATTPAPRVSKDVEQPLATTGPTTAAEAAARTAGPTAGPTTGRVTSSPVVAGVETSAPSPVLARATAPARRSPAARSSAGVRPHPAPPNARPASPTSHPAPASPTRPPGAATPTLRPRATPPAPVLPSAATGKPAPVLPSPASGTARAVPTR
jgi:ribonuclease E